MGKESDLSGVGAGVDVEVRPPPATGNPDQVGSGKQKRGETQSANDPGAQAAGSCLPGAVSRGRVAQDGGTAGDESPEEDY
jgi:hypothetical protein